MDWNDPNIWRSGSGTFVPTIKTKKPLVDPIETVDDLEAALALLPGSQIVAIDAEGEEAVMDADGVFRHTKSLQRPRIVMRWNGKERILFGSNKQWWDNYGSPRTNIYGGIPTMVNDLAKAIYLAVEQGRFSR